MINVIYLRGWVRNQLVIIKEGIGIPLFKFYAGADYSLIGASADMLKLNNPNDSSDGVQGRQDLEDEG